MKDIIDQLQKQKIVILGLGREGQSTYKFLRQQLPEQKLTLADEQDLTKFPQEFQDLIKADQNIELKIGPDYLKGLNNFDIIFKTAGIPTHTPQIKQAIDAGTKLNSNVQLFFEIINSRREAVHPQEAQNGQLTINHNPIIIGITGTKGKSTTSSMIHHVLKEAGQDTIIVGNIGIPALSQIEQVTDNTKVVFELSCHQLADLPVSPQISVIQNITSEHLDYYRSTEEYIEAKSSITKYQKVNDYVIYNQNYGNPKKLGSSSKAQQLKFSLEKLDDSLVYIKDDYLIFRYSQKEQQEQIIKISDIPLLGKHNILNTIPSIIVAKLFDIPTDTINQAIKSFKSLEHRLELVETIDGVAYYNDSQATMPDAAVAGLKAFVDKTVHLIAGGHERHQDFSGFADQIIAQKVKSLILFPTTGSRIERMVKDAAQIQNIAENDLPSFHHVNSMAEAIQIAHQNAQNGEVVLMSPGAASFGVFQSYADRGEQFRKYVQELK